MQLGTKLSDVDVGAVLDLLSQYGDRDAMLAPHRKHRTVARGGCIAGQAVSSAIQDLYFGGRGGVFDILAALKDGDSYGTQAAIA